MSFARQGCASACRLGNSEEAWDWLEDAFELGDAAKVKLMALEDPDLKEFWAEIGEVLTGQNRARILLKTSDNGLVTP